MKQMKTAEEKNLLKEFTSNKKEIENSLEIGSNMMKAFYNSVSENEKEMSYKLFERKFNVIADMMDKFLWNAVIYEVDFKNNLIELRGNTQEKKTPKQIYFPRTDIKRQYESCGHQRQMKIDLRIIRQERENKKQEYENLPETIKQICEKKFEVVSYMKKIEDDRYTFVDNRKMVERALIQGANPAVTYIDEVGNAVIRGVIISNQHYSLIHNVIYENEFITELIEELKIALPDAI